MGKTSRTKGHAYEREVCAKLRSLFGEGVRRSIQTRGAKSEGCDVDGTPYWIETKVGKLQNPRAALRQAIDDTDGRPPVAVIKDNSPGGGRPAFEFVAMRLDDFVALLEQAHRLPGSD
jgi:hypothetical protein